MKRFGLLLFVLLFFVAGCSSQMMANKEDLLNNLFTLNQREETDINSGTVAFTENTMEWKIIKEGANPNTEKTKNDMIGTSEDITYLEDIQIETKGEKYIIRGKNEGKKIEIIFYKQGKDRIKDEMGNVYAQ